MTLVLSLTNAEQCLLSSNNLAGRENSSEHMKEIYLSTESTSLRQAVQHVNEVCIELKTSIRVHKCDAHCMERIPSAVRSSNKYIFTFKVVPEHAADVLDKSGAFSRQGIGVSQAKRTFKILPINKLQTYAKLKKALDRQYELDTKGIGNNDEIIKLKAQLYDLLADQLQSYSL